MKIKFLSILSAAFVAAALISCSASGHDSHDHDHEHEHADHADHDHADHDHAGHDHAAGEDHADHDHAGHDHDHEKAGSSAKADAHAHGKDDIQLSSEQAKAAGVVIETIAPADFAQVIKVSGSILPAQGSEATVSATQSGIVRLAGNQIAEGAKVGKGQTLFQIATQAVGDGNPVAAAKAEKDAAEKEWERAQVLIKDHIITQKEYEAARQRVITARAAAVSMGNGEKAVAITAPLNGYLQNLLVRNGDFVTAGQALGTVSQNQRLQLRADVPERYYGSLPLISSANFIVTYAADTLFQLEQMNGRLLSSARTVNKGEGFLPVIFEFDNPGKVIPGSMAEIFLLGKAQPHTISVPTTALTEEMGLYYVYIQVCKDAYRKQLVKKGANNGARTEILSGLHAGDKVVAKGAIAVKLAANSNALPDPHAGHNH